MYKNAYYDRNLTRFIRRARKNNRIRSARIHPWFVNYHCEPRRIMSNRAFRLMGEEEIM